VGVGSLKLFTRVVTVAAVAATVLMSAPVAADADASPAARTSVAVPCSPPSQNTGLGGVTHAQVRQCSVLWISSGASGQQGGTITFQLRDAATDGVCAQAFLDFYYGSRHSTTTKSECNGVWTDYSYTVITTAYWHEADLTLSFGGRGPVLLIDINPFPPL